MKIVQVLAVQVYLDLSTILQSDPVAEVRDRLYLLVLLKCIFKRRGGFGRYCSGTWSLASCTSWVHLADKKRREEEKEASTLPASDLAGQILLSS